MSKKLYAIYLKNNKKVYFWFIGPQLEIILKEYNIKYEIVERNKNDK